MKMTVNKNSTSPKAQGTPLKSKTVGSTGSLSLPQYGGEGDSTYKNKKTDMSYPQSGGEGGGKEGKVADSSDGTLLNPMSKEYVGTGRDLKCESGA